MAKECGPSAAQDKLNETIAGAKGELDSLIGDSVGGLADSNVPLKDKISGLTDGTGQWRKENFRRPKPRR